MNTTQAHQMLHQVMYVDPTRTPSDSPSTFLVVEVVKHETKNGIALTVLIIDPSIPDSGDATAYLELDPIQRLVLELGEIVSTTASGVSAVVRHAPLDEDLLSTCQNDKNKLVQATRAMATKAAVIYLANSLPQSKADSMGMLQ